MKKNWFVLVSLFLGLCLLTAGAANAEIPKNILVMGESHENFKSLDPAVCFEVPASNMVSNMYAKLVFTNYKDEKFVVEPDLAESWEVAADNKTWTFHLREGLKFDNGDPLTAEDVVYSLTRIIKLAKSPSWLFTDVLGLTADSVTAVDERTVKMVTNGAPPNVVLTNLGNNPAGIVNKKVVEAHAAADDMGSGWLTDHSAGAGPYVLKDWKRNDSLLLEANPNWWKGQPAFKMVIVKDIPESTDRLLQIKRGDIDVAWHLTAEQVNGLKDNPDIQIVSTPGQSDEYVGMNAGWGPFKDVRVRTAVKYAIDYKSIIDKVKAGFAINNQQFLAIGYFGYQENNPWKQDLEKAKALMKEAGYENGFEVELVTNTREERRNEAVIVQENLAQIGIKASINVMPAAQMYAKFREQGINMIVAGWGIDYPDADALANPFANHRVKQLAWRLGWLDDKAADMAEAAGKEMDEAKREQMYHDLTNYWHENGPFAMLYQPIDYWAVSKNVKGAQEAFGGYSVHLDFTKMSK